MSWYYNYSLGYKQDGKIYPLFPFDKDGKLKNILSLSRSFEHGLNELFERIPDEMLSEEIIEQFDYYYKIDKEDRNNYDCVFYADIKALPEGDYIKSNYYLLDDIERYLRRDEEGVYLGDLFYDYIPKDVYAIKLQQELIFGKPTPQYDCEGNELETHSCRDYAYFTYPQYDSIEYDAFVIREFADIVRWGIPKEASIVVLMTQG